MFTKKEEAIRLRVIERMSLSKIASLLGVAKSTVSIWVREFPLTDKEISASKSHRAEPTRGVECVICGREFKTYRENTKYCSNRCSHLGDPKRKVRIVNATRRKRNKQKEKAIEYKGGKCLICGYAACKRALKFHHIYPADKDFTISGAGKSWDKVKLELDKCILVCGNCHDEIHEGLIDVPVK